MTRLATKAAALVPTLGRDAIALAAAMGVSWQAAREALAGVPEIPRAPGDAAAAAPSGAMDVSPSSVTYAAGARSDGIGGGFSSGPARPARDVAPGESWAFRDHKTMAEID